MIAKRIAMSVIEISKIKVKRATGPVVRPVNEDEFFGKKAEEARRFLELNPPPEQLFKTK